MQSLPPSLIPYFIGSIVFAIFCWRAVKNYLRLHNPLSKYFGIIAGMVALAFGTWTIPLLFTHDITVVTYANIIGDLFLYAFYVACAAFVYYLALRNHVPRALFMVIVSLLAIVGWASHVYGYVHYGIALANNELNYSLPTISSVIQLILIVNVFLVGILVLQKLGEQQTSRGRLGLIGISVLFILSGMAGTANIISSDGYSPSPVILGSYLVAFLFFVVVLVAARVRGHGQ